MSALYNEHDRYPAEWLRNLIAAGHIAPGDVDERSIHDLTADDVSGRTRVHLFAGIGGWDYALRLAGWPEDRPVWTGSCPCQPFSGAGKGLGFQDPRHLWPEMFRLIRGARPPVVFGEQVASALAWLDLVSGDLEGEGYTFGAAIVGAHSVGAPHIRQRIYWVAESDEGKRRRIADGQGCERNWQTAGREQGDCEPQSGGDLRSVADSMHPGRAERRSESRDGSASGLRGDGILGDPEDQRHERNAQRGWEARGGLEHGGLMGDSIGERLAGRVGERRDDGQELAAPQRAGGFWSDLIWLPCRDGKQRPTQPGLFPLAHGVPGRVGRLRAYGNAIVPQVAAAFVMAFMEATA